MISNKKDPLGMLRRKSVAMPSGCVEWSGPFFSNGYGHATVHYKHYLAHRIMWILAHGEVPDGLCVCHRCDNKRCINLEHLYVATPEQNSSDARKTGRYKIMAEHGAAKLTFDQVTEILTTKTGHAELGRKFGVTDTHIYSIRRGVSWKTHPARKNAADLQFRAWQSMNSTARKGL